MKKFTRQKSGNAPTADIEIDFGAAAARAARTFEPGEYRLRIASARMLQPNQNLLVVLDLVVMAEDGGPVASRPLWIDGPNAGGNQLAENNKHLVAQLLALAGQPTKGKVSALIPHLAGLEFDGHLVLGVDKSGAPINALDKIYTDDAS